jgi:hypothetical protein
MAALRAVSCIDELKRRMRLPNSMRQVTMRRRRRRRRRRRIFEIRVEVTLHD